LILWYHIRVSKNHGCDIMVCLNEEMIAIFEKNKKEFRVFPMATSSKDGIPNVAPMASVWLEDNETIWVCDNYMAKTLHNLNENPVMSMYFWNPDTKRCFQIKGDAEIKTNGSDYDVMYRRVKAVKSSYPAKSLIVMKITEVFECTPGKVAGKKII